MILPAQLCHKEQMVTLWSYAFGDKAESVEKFLDKIFKYFLVYEEDGIVKGMLSVLPVTFYGKNGGYIYAVTTHKKFRGQGICSKLMETVKADKKYNFLVLKPQNDNLFEFYEKMGFKKVSQLEKEKNYAKKVKKSEYKFKILSAEEYETARNSYFGENIIKWDSRMLSYAKDMYNGNFYAIDDGKNFGCAFAYCDENTAVIKEMLSEEHEIIANLIANILECEKVVITFNKQNGNEGFMIYPKDVKNGYFNIYLD